MDNFGKALTRDEPTAAVTSNVVVEVGDSKLTVRWDAVPDEEGKPSVTGYEVRHRERNAEDRVDWAVGEPTSSSVVYERDDHESAQRSGVSGERSQACGWGVSEWP